MASAVSSKVNEFRYSQTDTLIIGGGIAGLACARHLSDANIPFTLVTDTLGGRFERSAQGHYFGAAMLNNDHVKMKKYAKKSTIRQPSHFQAYLWDGEKPRLAMLSASPIGFFKGLKAFGPFLKSMKKLREQMPHTCLTELVARDPLLSRLISQSAEDFAKEHGIEIISDKLFGPSAGAIFMVDWREMNAFFFCLGATWIGLGSLTGNGLNYHDWSDLVPKLTKGYADQIVIETVESVREINGGEAYQATSGSRTWRAKNLVLALPGSARVAFGQDIGIEDTNPARDIDLHVFHIKGKRRAFYKPGCSLLLGMKVQVPMLFVLPGEDGPVDVLYANTGEPDFSTYYEDYKIIVHKHWSPALQLTKGPFRKLQPKPHVFMIGDHNIGGLEESYLTGLFAANKIIADRPSS
ncbi:MAG: hypothetical protein ACR2P1_16245 [Pseudomonadales bacterium]